MIRQHRMFTDLIQRDLSRYSTVKDISEFCSRWPITDGRDAATKEILAASLKKINTLLTKRRSKR